MHVIFFNLVKAFFVHQPLQKNKKTKKIEKSNASEKTQIFFHFILFTFPFRAHFHFELNRSNKRKTKQKHKI